MILRRFFFKEIFASGPLLIPIALLSVAFFSGCSSLRPPRFSPQAVYRVQRGDTPSAIAARFGVSLQALLEENGLPERVTIFPGDPLALPEGYLQEDTLRNKPQVQHEILGTATQYIGALQWPLPGGGKERGSRGVSSGFGKRWSSFHEGIDLPAPIGTPILAAHDGEVIYSGDRMDGYGNMVVIRGDSFLTAYAHNRRNEVRRGDQVRRGEQIAELGRTGNVTGPHLHFETRIKNASGRYVAVDPLVFFQTSS